MALPIALHATHEPWAFNNLASSPQLCTNKELVELGKSGENPVLCRNGDEPAASSMRISNMQWVLIFNVLLLTALPLTHLLLVLSPITSSLLLYT